MKKIVTIFTIVCMLASMSLVAFADTTEATVTSIKVGGTDINLTLIDNFSTTRNDAIEQWDGANFKGGLIDTDLGKAVSVTTSATYGVNSFRVAVNYLTNPDDTNSWAQDYWGAFNGVSIAGATAFVLRIKNNANNSAFSFEPIVRDASGNGIKFYQTTLGTAPILVDSRGYATPGTYMHSDWNNGCQLINIPVNFDGYLIIPTDSLATDKAATASDFADKGIVDIWDMAFFLQGGASYNFNLYDMYVTTSALPTVNQNSWIKSIVSGENGSATITLGDNINTDTSWTEIAIFTEEQNITKNSDIYGNMIIRDPGDFAMCPASGIMSATIGPDGEFPFEFEEGKTYYVYITRCVMSKDWDYQTVPYVFTYNAPTEGSSPDGDVSVVLYAAAALVSGGAFIALKKRRV